MFVSTTPAELILLTGEPNYLGGRRHAACSGSATPKATCSAWAQTGPVYYLVAGRWFSAPDFTGPWTFATPTLPADFKKIPLEHPRSRVLASVPGTTQAAEAVLLAQIPQTARVNKKEMKAPDVAYQGEPEFEADRTTTRRSARSTPTRTSSRSATSTTCASRASGSCRSAADGAVGGRGDVPKEIYKIPVSSPSHHVTYVTVEDDDDDDWVTFATAAAYTG